ncbi:hypothetical protein [Moritella sp.]|uniref:hypothetical protein n=1 Tax=Moritella sp. TaxID=78556 RepID=UPI001DF0A99C|nr:hypothetical protein [Moritella sp.]MCJ8350874.1 hypothetical protein [Moritella sp.]NQZ40438.1 hypothetical protein [Moritella sp.]
MAKNARSIKLDKAIEAELNIMQTQGIEKAPISAVTLHERLIAKGVITGKLSTLTSRADMIAEYRFLQMSDSDMDKDEPKYGTVEYYKGRNQKLIAQNSELTKQLSANTAALDIIIKTVESQSAVKIEELIRNILMPMEDVPF